MSQRELTDDVCRRELIGTPKERRRAIKDTINRLDREVAVLMGKLVESKAGQDRYDTPTL